MSAARNDDMSLDFALLPGMPAPSVTPSNGEAPQRETFHADDDQRVLELPLTTIRPNARQPRGTFAREGLDELAASILQNGRVLQPILVRRVEPDDEGTTFEIVAGERRWRASYIAKKPTVRAIVEDADDGVSARMALVENMVREDLNTMEEARGCARLHDAFGMSKADIGRMLGKDRSLISYLIKLLDLHDGAQAYIAAGALSENHGRQLLRLDWGDQKGMAQRCARGRWSVLALKDKVDEHLGVARAAKAPRVRTPLPSADEQAVLTDLTEEIVPMFGARPVVIAPQPEGAYEIRVWCADLDELKATVRNARNPNPTENG